MARLRKDYKRRLTLESLEPRAMLAADLFLAEDLALADDLAAAAHALFAPGTPAEYMAQVEEAADGLAAYQATQRWHSTSSDGDGLGWGDATTLTWSIAPDGTAIDGFTGEAAGSSNFVSFMKSIYGSKPGGVTNQPWFSIVASVFDRWSELSGITFVYESHDDGAAFSNIASRAPGEDGVRGDIRLGGHAIDGASGTLAYNFFPDNGEMILDTSDSFFFDTTGDSLKLRNVMAHELGHGLGLSHVDPVDQTKLMEPYASTSFDGPQHDDILAIQRLYGDAYDSAAGNNSFSTAVDLGALSRKSISIGDNAADQYVSIDGATDVDYFRFTAGAGASLGAKLTPLGHTYQQGGVDGSTSSFNSKTQNNLTLEVYDASRTLVARANSRGLGGSESLTDLELADGGVYFVRIRGDRDAAQLYQLDLTVSAGASGDVIDFYEYTIDSYGGAQDHSGSAQVEDGGTALRLTGNVWKKIDFTYTITADTVLEFDFASSSQGDVHGIGFDSNSSISEGLTFQLYGKQDWGLADYNVYTSANGVRHFVIPVGQFYTGKATSLVFVNDHDVTGANAQSIFSNVRIYEGPGVSAVAAPRAANDHIVVNEDSPTVAFNALANDDGGGQTLAITKVSAASAGGYVSIAADGRIHYRPTADFNGTETFTYTAASAGGTSTATVTVTVRAMNDLPEAGDNRYAVTSGKTYRLNVLSNDTSGVDAGETLSIVGMTGGSAGGKIVNNGGSLTYTPAAGFVGTETFKYTINDGVAGSNATATVTVRVEAPASQTLDFRDHDIDAYGGSQDGVGAALVENSGAALHLIGNTWKKIDLPYTITRDTVLEFDFSSTSQGDIHGIGLDNNDTITASRTFRLYGRQNWGVGDFDTYTSSAGVKHYVIPIGKYYTGLASYLFFTNDHDVTNPTAQSLFQNVRIYEASQSTTAISAAPANTTPAIPSTANTTSAELGASLLERLLLDTLDPPSGDRFISGDDIAQFISALPPSAAFGAAATDAPPSPSSSINDRFSSSAGPSDHSPNAATIDAATITALDHLFAALGAL